MELNQPLDGFKRGPKEEVVEKIIKGMSEEATLASGSAHVVLNDHSHHDHSKHHYGDVREYPVPATVNLCI